MKKRTLQGPAYHAGKQMVIYIEESQIEQRTAYLCVKEYFEDKSFNWNDYLEVFNQGLECYKNSIFGRVILLMNAAISINPDSAKAYYIKGNALSRLEINDEAIEAYNQAITINPHFSWAYNNLGRALAKIWRYEEAIEAYNQAITINPHFAVAYNNKGCAQYKAHRYEEAIEAYDQVIALEPKYSDAHHNKSAALIRLGKNQDAIAELAEKHRKNKIQKAKSYGNG